MKGRLATLTDDSRDEQRARATLRKARSERSQIDLDRVARVYRQAPSRPTEAVAAEFGVAHRTASRYAQRPREAGLLPPSAHGRKAT